MKIWTERPREEAHLLNPAFCCIVISGACTGYQETIESGLPFPLTFMVLPIVLHKPTRTALPNSIRTSLPAWIQENASARVQFYERLMSLKPHTREAIAYGLQFDYFAFHGGKLRANIRKNIINRALNLLEDEARECVLRARFLGKWFASVGSAETTMALWGIRP